MTFKLEEGTLDFGETSFENLFITNYLPSAPADYVKVYMLGIYYAQHDNRTASNETIAKQLSLPIEHVVAAWHYWQRQKIIAIIKSDVLHSDHQFEIVFKSIRQHYVIEQKELPYRPTKALTNTSDRLMAAMTNPVIKKMFADVEFTARRRLTAQEMQRVLDFIFNYKMDVDMVVKAFEIAYDKRDVASHHLAYIEGIIKNWHDLKIFSSDDLAKQEGGEDSNYQLVRKISRLLGFNLRNIPTEVQRAVATWQAAGYDDSYIIYVVQETTKRTNNPNINYVNSKFKAIDELGDSSLQGAQRYFNQSHAAPSKVGKEPQRRRTNFQNFSQDTIANLSPADLEAIIKKKSQRAE